MGTGPSTSPDHLVRCLDDGGRDRAVEHPQPGVGQRARGLDVAQPDEQLRLVAKGGLGIAEVGEGATVCAP